MKTASIALFTAVLLFFAAAPAAAQDNQPADRPQPGTKLGFVSSIEVLYGTQEGQEKIGHVQTFIEEKQAEFDQRQEELQRLRSQIEAQRRTLNLQTLTDMQRQIDEKDRALRRFQEDTQFEINRRRDEILQSMERKIQQVITEFAQQGGYSAIFLRDDSQIYVAPSLDVTAEIVRLYDEKYPAPSASQPSAAQQP